VISLISLATAMKSPTLNPNDMVTVRQYESTKLKVDVSDGQQIKVKKVGTTKAAIEA